MIETQWARRAVLPRHAAPTRRRGDDALLARARRPLRFALTGGLCGLLQLGLLALLVGRGWPAAAANVVAFALAAQLNFGLSSVFTWRDRPMDRPWWRRWLAFHAAIATMAVVNQGAFLAARTVLPPLVAAAAGIAVAALGNYLVGDRVVFRGRSPHAGSMAVRQGPDGKMAVRQEPDGRSAPASGHER